MADWTFSWKPNYVYTATVDQRTLVTPFESGKEQRRQKWSTPRHRFMLVYNAKAKATMEAIKAFFEAREGRYDSFSFPNYGQSIKGTRLACVNSNPDTITDSSSGFLDLGFDDGQRVWISGSGQSNDGVYDIDTAAAGTLTLESDEGLAAESANALLEAFRVYTVRFDTDVFEAGFLTPNLARIKTIPLIEVI